MQNHPNPFNGYTTISYTLTKPGYVAIKIFDIIGNEVAEIINENKSIGDYRLQFNAGELSEGIYYYSMMFNDDIQTKKMIVIH